MHLYAFFLQHKLEKGRAKYISFTNLENAQVLKSSNQLFLSPSSY